MPGSARRQLTGAAPYPGALGVREAPACFPSLLPPCDSGSVISGSVFGGKKEIKKEKKDWIKPNFYLSTVHALIKKLAPNLNPDYAVKCIEPEAAWLFARPMIH